MNVVDLLYNERHWNKRIFEAGEMGNLKKRKCDHGLFGLLGFLVGFLVCYSSLLGLFYISL